MCKRRLRKLAVLSIGAPLGNLEWSSFPGDFERESKRALCKRSDCLYGSSVRGTWREGSYTEDSE